MTDFRVTEYLAIDTAAERWRCAACAADLGSARRNYKEGCLVAERDPTEVHPPRVGGPYTFAPDPAWCRLLEFYCPGCLVLVEVEYLPPGHPITHDIEIDIDALKATLAARDDRAQNPGAQNHGAQNPGAQNHGAQNPGGPR